jgi:hypothetical protein
MAIKHRPRRSSPLNLPSAWSLFSPSKKIILDNIWIFGPLYAVPLVFGLHAWIWSPANTDHHWYSSPYIAGPDAFSSSFPTFTNYGFIGFSFFWFLFVAIVGFITQIMVQRAQLDGVEGKAPDFEDLWATVKELGWRMVGLYLLVSLVTLVGFFLLIFPGIIMIRRYFLAQYVLLDQKTGIREAMDISADMTKPYSHSIYAVILVSILFGCFAFIPFIGWIIAYVLGAFYSVAPALRYQQLKKIS